MAEDEFIDKVIPPELIGTGPNDGLPDGFLAGCDASLYVPPNDIVGSLRTSRSTFF
jgi:hypothetical protein